MPLDFSCTVPELRKLQELTGDENGGRALDRLPMKAIDRV